MSLIDKVYEMKQSITAAEVQNAREIIQLPEGKWKRKLKYLALLFPKLDAEIDSFNDILRELDDFEEAKPNITLAN